MTEKYKLILGDCLEKLKELEDNSIDTILTDPPYGLEFMGKEWDKFGGEIVEFSENETGGLGGYKNHIRFHKGLEGMQSFQKFTLDWATEVLRVAKPGATLLCFGGCYDDKTEALTDNGWKFFQDISKNDKVVTLNPETEIIEYQSPIEIVKYNHYKSLYHFKTNKIDLLVTPNHKLLTKYMGGYKNAKWKLIEADKIKSAIKMKKDGKWSGKDKDIFILPATKQSNGHHIIDIPKKAIPMDIWLKFFGLWIAEGSASIVKSKVGYSYKTQICHFNNDNLDELEKELSSYFTICRYKKSGKFVINNKQLVEYLNQFGKAWEKFIPLDIKQLSSEKLKILLDWYLKGDGDSDRMRATTTSKKLVDDLQEIALKTGISADYSIRKSHKGFFQGREIKSKHLCYTIAFNLTQNEPEVYQAKQKQLKIKSVEPYNGIVYCVEVPKYHTLYVRRNGKVCWCGNTRTWHRLACAIEDSGWMIKDTIMWIYGSGFPKAYNIPKGIDAKIRIGKCNPSGINSSELDKNTGELVIRVQPNCGILGEKREVLKRENAELITSEAQLWNGYKSHGLKPAYEPIIMAMKPNEGSYCENALKWGVAGLNINEARIGYKDEQDKKLGQSARPSLTKDTMFPIGGFDRSERSNIMGRFPANLLMECICDEVREGEVKTAGWTDNDLVKGEKNQIYVGGATRGQTGKHYGKDGKEKTQIHTNPGCPCYMLDNMSGDKSRSSNKSYPVIANNPIKFQASKKTNHHDFGDKGGASRFFYCAKASRSERGKDNKHPTVKPLKLMEYLVKLTSMPNLNQIYLDPFAGSGTTLIACKKLGKNFIGIEKEKEYFEIAKQRINEYMLQLTLF